MIALGMFVIAVAVSLVFERQERRHRSEMRLEYEHLGWELPAARPKVPTAEAVLNIALGVVFVAMGAGLFYTYLFLESIGQAMGGQYYVALFFAVGIALITVGVKALKENREY